MSRTSQSCFSYKTALRAHLHQQLRSSEMVLFLPLLYLLPSFFRVRLDTGSKNAHSPEEMEIYHGETNCPERSNVGFAEKYS